MKIQNIGEFGLIDRIAGRIKPGRGVVKGIGDDAAVLVYDRSYYQFFTTDMLVDGAHFISGKATYVQIGHKSLACSISDIAAMGGIPTYAVCAIGLPKGLSVKAVDGIYRGMDNLAKKFAVTIVGGDTICADKLTISISLLGKVEKKNLVLRSGAKVRDFIFVTGKLGGSIFGRHLTFTPRLKEARILVNNFKINSMIDISDGLSSDLGHICKASKTGAIIFESFVPGSGYAKNIKSALNDGEDFELLFTMPAKESRKLMRSPICKKLKISLVGEILDRKCGVNLLTADNKLIKLEPGGFKHF